MSKIVVKADELSINDAQQDLRSRHARPVEVEIGSELFDGVLGEENIIKNFIQENKLAPRLQALSAAKQIRDLESQRKVNVRTVDSESEHDSRFLSASDDSDLGEFAVAGELWDQKSEDDDALFTVNTMYGSKKRNNRPSSLGSDLRPFFDSGYPSDVDHMDMHLNQESDEDEF